MADIWKPIALQIIFPLTILVVFYSLFNLRRRKIGNDSAGVVPGNPGLPIFGETFSFFKAFKNPGGVQSFTDSRTKRYGRTFFTNIVGKDWVFTSNRETVKVILSSEHSLFRNGSTKASENLFGINSIFYARGADIHRKIRRLVGEPISGENLRKNFERMEAICLEILDEWSGKTVSTIEGTSRFAFQIISHVIASLGKGSEQSMLYSCFMDLEGGQSSFAIKIPGASYYRACKARQKILALLDIIIDRRRKGEEIKDDFIQSMIARDGLPEEERLTDSEIKDNCLSLLLAGHATTGAALTWAMKFLEENPDAKETLMEEYKRIQAKKAESNATNLTWDDIQQMPYTSKVILETLRMSNIIPWTARVALHDISLQGYHIKKDCVLAINNAPLHYDPEIFLNPMKFNPSRFDETQKAYSFVGFGGGARACLGINLAKLEMTIFLYHLCTKFRWRSVGIDNTMSSTFIRVLNNGYQIQIEPK